MTYDLSISRADKAFMQAYEAEINTYLERISTVLFHEGVRLGASNEVTRIIADLSILTYKLGKEFAVNHAD